MAIFKSNAAHLVIMIILIISVISIPSSSMQNTDGANSVPAISNMSNGAVPHSGMESPSTVYYLSSNLSVPANSTFTFSGYDMLAESLSLPYININVYGGLELLNSTLSILNATYNTVEAINITLHSDSFMRIDNSTLDFPGMLNASRSNITIDNSTIECQCVNDSDPLVSNYLGENFSRSVVSIINSSVSGLIHQQAPYEFPDAHMFVNQASFQKFSANGTVPMKSPESPYPWNVLMNGIHLDVTYTGTGNESSDSLLLKADGKVVKTYLLPNNTDNTSELSETIYGGMFVHTARWFASTSNFSLVLEENSSYPVGIANVTLTLESNDTVHAKGYSAYDLMLYHSTAEIMNSSLALNFRSSTVGYGIPDFIANHMLATNSTIIWTDSSVSGLDNYSASPFQLNNSTVYMYRLARVLPEDKGGMVSNFRYSVSPETPLPYSMLNNRGVNMTQCRPLSINRFIALSGIQVNSSYLYTGTYKLNWETNVTTVSLEPFPDLSRATVIINVSVPAPVVTLRITGAMLYSGNLTVNMTYSVYDRQEQSLNGTAEILAVGENGIIINAWKVPVFGLETENFSLKYHISNGQNPVKIKEEFVSDQMYAMSGLSVDSTSVDLEYPANASIRVSVAVTGYEPGAIWIMEYGGKYFISNSSSLDFNSSANLTPTIIPPAGYRISDVAISYAANHTEFIVISFSEIRETATFVEETAMPGQQWSVLIAGRNYSTTDSMLNVSLKPGVYNYQVSAPRGMKVRDSSGIVNLTDSNATVSLMFFDSFSLVTLLDIMASQIVFYAFLATAAGIAVTGISMWRKRSWYICRSCGASVDKGRKYCDKCEGRRK